ncbi:DUF2087 domain-containing protein [Phaeobacter sp. HF9A]|uniref:DUF2087 domain-containing protein n=1 Tax=Phaeobacter sp. HF9A TaxID=2721561 RepID=UPI001430FE22|nr:DUF2087 domain-containing protein [Phaeobacter sp. HF9A]NIZ15006.1 DUF2087 domain-containing protein [Phaeobacter sp. HF9A]
MSKDVIRLTIPDVSEFSKHLRAALPDGPGHVEMLNLVAKAAGFRNFQHLRAQHPPTPMIDQKRIARAARYFDDDGRWKSWPTKRGLRELCLWVIWARLPARQRWSEREISAVIDEQTLFRDAAQIRRSLIEMRLMTRRADGSDYARVETPMDPQAAALLAHLAEREKAARPQETADAAFVFPRSSA